MGTVWNAAKSVAEAVKSPAIQALELAGRPAEFVAGTVGGTLQTGNLLTGLQRGAAAAFEPNLRDSQIRESFSKVIEEQAPEFAKAHPLVTAGAGFGLDVVTDPTNLLAGSGLYKRGVQALGRGATEMAAATKLGEAFPSLRLRTLVAPGAITEPGAAAGKFFGMTADDMKRTAEAQGRAGQLLHPVVADLVAQTTPEQRHLLALATVYPKSAEAAAVAADPKLRTFLERTTQAFADIHAQDLATGVRPATRALDITESTAERLAALSEAERTAVERILRQGPDVPLEAADQALLDANTNMRKAVEGAQKKLFTTAKTGETFYFADPASVTIQPTGAIDVSTATKNYLPTMQEIGAKTEPYVTGGRRSYDLKAAETKTIPFREALADPKLKVVGDVAELLQRRARDSVRAQTETQLVRDYLGEFGSAVAKPGYTQFSEQFLAKSKMPQELAEVVRGRYLPDAIVKDLESTQLRLADPTAMDNIYRQGTRLWKTMATTLRLPAHQANNFLGNIANMYAGGNMPATAVASEYWKASQALRAEGAGKLTGAMAPIIEQARKLGVIGEQAGREGIEMTGMGVRQAPTGLRRAMTGAYNPLNPDNRVYEAIRRVNQQRIEDPAKLALFAYELKQGKSAEQASVTVRKVLFDYNELTPAERTIREYVPFYTWTRKNIPLQLATFVERPSKIAHQQQFLNLFREWSRLSGQAPLTRDEFTQYTEPGELAPLPMMRGTAGSPVAANLRLPFFDVSMLAPGSISEEVSSRLNPLLTTPLSLLRGQNVLTGEPMDRLKRPNLAGRILPEALGGSAPIGPRGAERQTAAQQLVTGLVPMPLDPVLRTLYPPTETETLPGYDELMLRSLGLSPVVRSPELRQQAFDEQRRMQQQARQAELTRRRR
ncbi:MAG: hypothetical protein EBS05_16840 [Proteobacteria bacterium]|nr:hypothetical protein [Pseudomonadota bacterium]